MLFPVTIGNIRRFDLCPSLGSACLPEKRAVSGGHERGLTSRDSGCKSNLQYQPMAVCCKSEQVHFDEGSTILGSNS